MTYPEQSEPQWLGNAEDLSLFEDIHDFIWEGED